MYSGQLNLVEYTLQQIYIFLLFILYDSKVDIVF